MYFQDEEKEVEDGVTKEEADAINVSKEDGEQNIADNQNDSEKGIGFFIEINHLLLVLTSYFLFSLENQVQNSAFLLSTYFQLLNNYLRK